MIDKNLILSLTDRGLDVFKFYLPPFRLRKNFANPFYEDKKPSCNVYFDGRHNCWRFHDFGDATYSGDCFWLVSLIYGYDMHSEFYKVLQQISSDLSLGLFDDEDYSVQEAMKVINPHRAEPSTTTPPETSKAIPYNYAELPWEPETLSYWGGYGIPRNLLEHYDVVPVDTFTSFSRKGRQYTIKGSHDQPIYGYRFSTCLKLYRPLSRRMKFLYAGKVPSPYMFGYDQLPESGDLLIITGGEKDVLSLASRGYRAICFNSETKSIPREILRELSDRFAHVGVLFDMDDTGVRSSETLVSAYPDLCLTRIILPISGRRGDKDVSDFLSKGNNDDLLHEIINKAI